MQRPTHTTVVRTAAIAVASVFLAGCFTVEATFTIKDDATADIDYLVVIDAEQLQEFAGMLGEDAGALDELSGDALLQELTGDEDPCAGLTEELTDYDISTREIDEDGSVGVGCTVSSVPIAELVSLGDDTSSFTIEQDDDGTRFDAVLEGVDELAGDPAETGAMTDMLGVDLDELFTIKFVVTAPGSLGDNNASSTDGSTATWDIKPDSDFVTDGDATMTAEWTPGGGGSGSSTWIVIAIVAVLAALAAVAVVMIKRSKGSTPQGPETPDASPASDAMSPPAPAAMAPPADVSTPPAPGAPPPPPPTATEPSTPSDSPPPPTPAPPATPPPTSPPSSPPPPPPPS
jgi:hypothetical protein